MVKTMVCGAIDVGSIPSFHPICGYGVTVAALVLGTSDLSRAGSSPATRTIVFERDINMKRKRTLYFEKHIEIIDFEKGKHLFDNRYTYKTVNSIYIASFVINEIGYSKIVDWDFNDIGESKIILKCTKEEFEDFVTKFIKKFEDDVHDISFS